MPKICEGFAGCGASLEPGEAPHERVIRVVRPKQRFGGANGGEIVEVCVHVAEHRSTILATQTLDEAAADRKKAVERPKPKGRASVDMAREFAERNRQEYLERKAREEAVARQKKSVA